MQLPLPRHLALMLLCPALAAASGPYHAQGEMAGEINATRVLLQSRLTALPGPELAADGDMPGAKGVAAFEWSETADFLKPQRTGWLTADEKNDFIVRTALDRLQPGQRYYYRLVYGAKPETTQNGPTRSFKTLAPLNAEAPVSFCMGNCMHYDAFMSGVANGDGPVTATEEDKQLGFRVFAAMRNLQPDFFIGAGDAVYYDFPKSHPAKTLPELRKKWHEQFRLPRLSEFFGECPGYWSKDDHDFRFDDADLEGTALPSAMTGEDLFREQLPLTPQGDKDTPTYRTVRIHPRVQLWFLEGRDYRSPNSMPDSPGKSIWGATQKAWLEKTLKESDATWKLIVSPTPLVGPDRKSKSDNHTNPRGFRQEGDAFFSWLQQEKIENVMILSGDRHWQYHSIHPSGVEELSVGALNDENSILGEYPGQPGSTDPEGKIRQPYHYKEATGGFLYVTVTPHTQNRHTLRMEFRDDTGKILYQIEKTP
ncbi:alkaline phosphatase [Verrucomicrobia bacterium IMCC26134]|nr:alkaline phosphatase [Verrucomicrobia bacterium IMCC26134]